MKPQAKPARQPVISENAAGEPPFLILLSLNIVAPLIAMGVTGFGIWVFYIVPGPDWLKFTMALLSLGIPLHLVIWALEAMPITLAPVVWLRRHIPLQGIRDQVLAVTGILLAAAVALVASNWRATETPQPAPFTRAATARSAARMPVVAPIQHLIPVAVAPSAESRIAPFLHRRQRLHASAKPAPSKHRRRS